MTGFGLIIYFSFIIFIIISIILRKKPILIGALGLLAVGMAETKSFFTGIQIAFRGILLTAADLLPIILLIGLVVAMSTLLKETGTDTIFIQPLLRIRSASHLYWLIGLVLLILSFFLWPTPAVTLLAALILPLVNNSKINPVGLAVGLCIFGEGIGLAGDFVIQGAPSLLARSAGIEIEQVVASSVPLVLGSGLLAAIIGYFKFVALNKSYIQKATRNESAARQQADMSARSRKALAASTVGLFGSCIVYLLHSGTRGDSAAAVTGGVAILIIIIGSLLANYRTSLNAFGQYIQNGMKFSMGVFAPIIVIAGFFLLGTRGGNENILMNNGPGYLEQSAIYLSNYVVLNIFSCSLIVIFAAVLGAMSGSGFSALPLVGGIAAALGEAADIPVVPLAVLGQVAAIWTNATVIPWGFPAVVSAITQTDAVNIVRQGVAIWLAALAFIYIYTIWTFSY